jgi:hypothetical protein
LVDSIVVRQIWNITRNADLRVEADKIADRVHQIFCGLLIFLENSFGITATIVNKRINSDPKSWRFLSRLSATLQILAIYSNI